MSAQDAGAAAPRYDYLLVAGPGRSGSEFLYRNLQGHPQLTCPAIKEGYYYRSLKAFRKAWRLAGPRGKVLVDVANLGYRDTALARGAKRLREAGFRILVVLLVRDHCARAQSMMVFRRSRGEISALAGARRLEAAVVRDRLTSERLRQLYGLQVDVLTVRFPALVERTAEVLGALAQRCGIAPFGSPRCVGANVAAEPRAVWLSSLGKAVALALRRLGLRRTLQCLKDDRRVQTLFFLPARASGPTSLSERNRRMLEETQRECTAVIDRCSERIAEGVYLRPAGSG